MRLILVLTLSIFLVAVVTDRAMAQANAWAKVVRGELIYVLCANNVRVHSDDLGKVLFTSQNNERVRPFQGWGQNKKTAQVNGKSETYVKVQFANSENRKTDVGWVPQEFVKLKSECAGSEVPQVSIANDPLKDITGINDARCCLFPIKSRPQASFLTGPRQFGAGRRNSHGGYREHAGNDLYASELSDVRAVAPGKVLYSPREFYFLTKEVAIQHPGGFVARYGEITRKKSAQGIEGGSTVRTGQVVGFVGHTFDTKRKTFVATPMLHFELYSGKGHGSLSLDPTNKKNGPFFRRSDLMDPTKYMVHWEQISFN